MLKLKPLKFVYNHNLLINKTEADSPKFSQIYQISISYISTFPFYTTNYGSQHLPKNTISYIVFSYTLTLTALVSVDQKQIMLKLNTSKLLLVIIPEILNQSPVPGVKKKAQIIQKTTENFISVKLREVSPVQVTLNNLSLFNIIYFACHGYADLISLF